MDNAERRRKMISVTRRTLICSATCIAAASSAGRAFADGQVNYSIPGILPTLKQPMDWACWATVATMMYSWKNNGSYDIETALAKIGNTYLDIYKKNSGLSPKDKSGFLYSAGLVAEAPQNYFPRGWNDLLKKYGALWVTTAEGVGFSVHARILTGIFGDGTFDGTSLTIADPADGRIHTETVTVFAKKFEEVARQDLGSGGELRPQVVHYP
jgi:hypothetical protein